MAEIINAPCDTFRQLALAAMRRRITTLNQEGCKTNWSRLSELLVDEYEQSFGQPVYLDKLSSQECEKATKLADKMISKNYLEAVQVFGLPATEATHSAQDFRVHMD